MQVEIETFAMFAASNKSAQHSIMLHAPLYEK
jgi:hypothetical protein